MEAVREPVIELVHDKEFERVVGPYYGFGDRFDMVRADRL
jgi:hypothetical protein